jgi:hypothetical protein
VRLRFGKPGLGRVAMELVVEVGGRVEVFLVTGGVGVVGVRVLRIS